MIATFIQAGNTVDYVPGANVKAGDVVVQGELVGVAVRDIASGQLGALAVTGVFDFPKATGTGSAIAAGTRVYWDVADQVAKADSDTGANKLIGKTIVAAADASATVRVALASGDALTAEAVTPAAAVADAEAITATDAPAGGTGAAAGGWDTAEHRDQAIGTINALLDDVTELHTQFNALLDSLRDAGLLAE